MNTAHFHWHPREIFTLMAAIVPCLKSPPYLTQPFLKLKSLRLFKSWEFYISPMTWSSFGEPDASQIYSL